MSEAPPSLQCPNCGYDLRGQVTERCPECGFYYDPPGVRSLASAAWDDATDAYNLSIGFLGGNLAVLLTGIFGLTLFVAAGEPIGLATALVSPLLIIAPLPVAAFIRSRAIRQPIIGAYGSPFLQIVEWFRVFPVGVTLILLAAAAAVTMFCVVCVPLCFVILAIGATYCLIGLNRARRMHAVRQESALSPYKQSVLRRMMKLTVFLLAANLLLLIAAIELTI